MYHQEHHHQGSVMFQDVIVRGSVQVCFLAESFSYSTDIYGSLV